MEILFISLILKKKFKILFSGLLLISSKIIKKLKIL